MAIVIEGPDNSGKSTLAAELSEATGWIVNHSGGPGKPGDRDRIVEDMLLMQQDVIMDRSHVISETIYGNRLRGEPTFDARPQFRQMQSFDLYNDTFLLIFCGGDMRTICNMTHHIVKPHETEAHVRAVEAQKEQLYWDYQFMQNALGLFINVWKVDVRNDGGLVEAVLNHLNLEDQRGYAD